MTWLLLALVALSAFSPALLARHKWVEHKRLFVYVILLGVIKPLSTIIIPFMFRPDGFGTAMDNYLLLIFSYYLLIFFCYYFAIISLGSSRLAYAGIYLPRSRIFRYAVIALGVLFFGVLVLNSGGVFLIDPRQGYQNHREGVGFAWSLYIMAVGVAYYLYIVLMRISTLKVLLFAFLMFFTGSKQLILEVFLKSFFVYIWSGIRIKKWQFAVAGSGLVLLMLKQFDQTGAEANFISRVSEYFDFMYNASLVFNDYEAGNLEFQFGTIFLSSFWGYVPRALFPDKPYAYGSTYLVEMYYPGLAETGHTPSFGMLTPEFVDFGWFAPFFSVFFSVSTLLQIIALVIVSSRTNISNRFKFGAMAFVLVPGFGFQMPIFITILVAFVLLPKMARFVPQR